MRHLPVIQPFVLAFVLIGLAAGPAAQSTTSEPAEPPREQEADRQGAVAGEAPPASVQSERTPEGEGESPRTAEPAAPASRPPLKVRPADAREHLSRIDAIVGEALEGPREPKTGDEAVGTTGTPITEQTGETVTIERAKLEEIRLHVEQIRTALAGRGRP